MSYAFPPDLAAQVEAKLKTGRFSNEDEVLREAMAALDDSDDDYEAIVEALEELDSGVEGVSVDEAFRIVCERNDSREV